MRWSLIEKQPLPAEFDDVLVAVHPVVEQAQLITDRGDSVGGSVIFGLQERILV